MVTLKSVFKLISVMIIAFVVVFICTIFVSYPLDLRAIEPLITGAEMQQAFYGARVDTANVIITATVGLFGSIAVLILLFSIRQFINENSPKLGVLKALGYSGTRIALDFSKFGLSILVGSILGYFSAYCASPAFYNMLISGYELPADVVFCFRSEIFFILVIAPALFFSALSVLYAKLRLRKKPLDLIHGANESNVNMLTQRLQRKRSNCTFLDELKRTVLSNHLTLIFFVGFAAFAFSAQVQTAFTVRQLIDNTLMTSTFIISGLMVGSVTLLLSLTFIISKNKKYIAMLRAYGYTGRECGKAMFDGYRIATYIGFALGTCYQFLFIAFVIARAFESATIEFDFMGFFITFPVFIMAYELIMLFYKRRIEGISLGEIMQA